MKRTLSLKTETLSALTTDELSGVNGAARALSDRYGNCTIDESYKVCSLRCPFTVNTCG
jgi:hypothetical protein